MGLFGLGSSYQTKADCDRAIAKEQEDIARCKQYIATYRANYTGDNLRRAVASQQNTIAIHQANIARIRSIKAGLSR